MDIDGESAFDKVLDRLVDTAADKRLVEESRANLQAKLYDTEQKLAVAHRDLLSSKNDHERTQQNYEKLKKVTPEKVLAEHERAVDDIPF